MTLLYAAALDFAFLRVLVDCHAAILLFDLRLVPVMFVAEQLEHCRL